MDVNEFGLRGRTAKKRISLRRNFSETAADQHQQIGGFGARYQLRIRTEAEVAGIQGMQRIEQGRAAIARCDRQSASVGKVVNLTARHIAPAATAEHEQRTLRFA